jgi:plasmid stability protein
MANPAIHNLPDDLAKRVKALATAKGHSIEQKIRESLKISASLNTHISAQRF